MKIWKNLVPKKMWRSAYRKKSSEQKILICMRQKWARTSCFDKFMNGNFRIFLGTIATFSLRDEISSDDS